MIFDDVREFDGNPIWCQKFATETGRSSFGRKDY